MRFRFQILAIALISGPAMAREAAPAAELTACPKSSGDLDYAIASIMNAGKFEKLGYDEYARDRSNDAERSIGRVFSMPVVVFTFERIQHGGVVSIFMRGYRAPSMALAQIPEDRKPLTADQIEQLASGFKDAFNQTMPC